MYCPYSLPYTLFAYARPPADQNASRPCVYGTRLLLLYVWQYVVVSTLSSPLVGPPCCHAGFRPVGGAVGTDGDADTLYARRRGGRRGRWSSRSSRVWHIMSPSSHSTRPCHPRRLGHSAFQRPAPAGAYRRTRQRRARCVDLRMDMPACRPRPLPRTVHMGAGHPFSRCESASQIIDRLAMHVRFRRFASLPAMHG
jgi:hypothetical protein